MPAYLRVTVRFLQPLSHGRGEQGEPEWPPSPLRLFQALVAASAARWGDRSWLDHVAPVLRRLEVLPPPVVIAPAEPITGAKYRLYVPDNVADKVAATWSRGGDASIADYRTEKDVRPLHLRNGDSVHYLWGLPEPDLENDLATLFDAARSITHLGWGIDMVAADASVITESEAESLKGERWLPAQGDSPLDLRAPREGTLAGLVAKHEAFLDRIGPEGFHPVPPLTAFRVVGYRRSTDPSRRPYAAFRLLDPEAKGFRPFDPASWGVKVAGMLRHSASAEPIARAMGWSPEKVAQFALGHGEPIGQTPRPVLGPRLAFIPLPTIAPRGNRGLVVESIRRVLLTVFNGDGGEDIRALARLLLGSDLIPEHDLKSIALLAELTKPDNVLGHYCPDQPSATWATVTPAILPGFDDPRKLRRRLGRVDGGAEQPACEATGSILHKLERRVDELLRKAIRQAGFAEDLARFAEIEWRSVGFWPGTEHAIRYLPPEHLKRFRRLHVRITWRDKHQHQVPIPGPICLGGGRFCGLGLFAAIR